MALLLLAGCSSPGGLSLEGPSLRYRFDPAKGTHSISRGGQTVMEGATSDVLVRSGEDDPPRTLALLDAKELRLEGQVIVAEIGSLELRVEPSLKTDPERLEIEMEVRNHDASPIRVLRLSPLVVEAARGGRLNLGPDPRSHLVLENGRFVVFDQNAELQHADLAPFDLAGALPIPLRGNSVSNWSQALVDAQDLSQNVIAGWLSTERSVPTVGVAVTDGAFSTWAAECALVFHGKELPPEGAVRSERLYLALDVEDPRAGLEDFARRAGEYAGAPLWTARGKRVPSGWNSWTGGSGTGGYGQDIDAGIIAANLEVARRELGGFGLDTFPVDDGWQRATGDWSWEPSRFPAGGAATAAAIKDAGFVAGLWLAPFWVRPDAALAAAHPDWLLPDEDGLVGSFGKNRESLDLSNPEVLTAIGALLGGIRSDGFGWVKADFTYWDLLGKLQHDPSLTNMEAYRAGWRTMREALGPDVFLLGIGMFGANVGVVDGMRTTVDNGPRWETGGDGARSYKGTVRTGAHRWFYQNRALLRHDDLIFFRSWPDPAIPPLTLEETKTFASWVALGGGTVELGDRLVDWAQDPRAVDVIRRLLPADPEAARPLDLFEHELPEHYQKPITRPFGRWTIEGLFNWGTNADVRTNPSTVMPEEPRAITIAIREPSVLYEHWSGQYLGRFETDTAIMVPPRSARIIAVRPAEDHPQLLGTNRHLLMGAREIDALAWDAGQRRLSGSFLGAAGSTTTPFRMELAFLVPPTFVPSAVQVDGQTQTSSVSGEVLRIHFSSTDRADDGRRIPFSLQFR